MHERIGSNPAPARNKVIETPQGGTVDSNQTVRQQLGAIRELIKSTPRPVLREEARNRILEVMHTIMVRKVGK